MRRENFIEQRAPRIVPEETAALTRVQASGVDVVSWCGDPECRCDLETRPYELLQGRRRYCRQNIFKETVVDTAVATSQPRFPENNSP